MEKLNYIIEDSVIANILGVQNFSTDESAVLELIKNAYDANATEVVLEFTNEDLILTDNGDGMSADDIRDSWMYIGKSHKGYSTIDSNNKERVQAGSKGIGRFALSRLGKSVELSSKKRNQVGIIWETDWNESTLDEDIKLKKNGTCLKLKKLREKWNTNRIKNLKKYLERTYNDTAMSIKIIAEGYEGEVEAHFPEAEPGKNCRSNIKLIYNEGELLVEVFSDEFSDEVKKYCENIDLKVYRKKICVFDELKNNEITKLIGEKEDFSYMINEIGNFSANMFFNLNSNNMEKEKFLYKYLKTPQNVEEGIILYRNAFSISSYEGKKDWLGLSKRSRKSPAAASHPTGDWRVRENQMSGYVLIDKNENKVLQDLSNRQGLDENLYYEIFIQIILLGIREFERYRQTIIRKINIKNKVDEEISKGTIFDKILQKPNVMDNLTEKDKGEIISEIKSFKQREESIKFKSKEIEERHKYDISILNVLSTIGLKAASIAHEMRNDRNILLNNYTYIINALKKYGVWDILTRPENTDKSYKNVPLMIEKIKAVNDKVIVFMNTMMTETEKKQFEKKSQNIKEIINDIKRSWEEDYAFIEIYTDIIGEEKFILSKASIRVILDNLILNSIQQNESKEKLLIKIRLDVHKKEIDIIYSDNGEGLDRKYLDAPLKILEVHETTREEGHGLGMWIVNNSIILSGGKVKKIAGNNGFLIEFSLGDKV